MENKYKTQAESFSKGLELSRKRAEEFIVENNIDLEELEKEFSSLLSPDTGSKKGDKIEVDHK